MNNLPTSLVQDCWAWCASPRRRDLAGERASVVQEASAACWASAVCLASAASAWVPSLMACAAFGTFAAQIAVASADWAASDGVDTVLGSAARWSGQAFRGP